MKVWQHWRLWLPAQQRWEWQPPGAPAHLTRIVLALLLAHDDKDDSSASLKLQIPFLQCANPPSPPLRIWLEGGEPWEKPWVDFKAMWERLPKSRGLHGVNFHADKNKRSEVADIGYLFGIPWPSFRKWPSLVSIWGATSKQSLAYARPRIKSLSLSGHECQRWVSKWDAFASEMFVQIVWSWVWACKKITPANSRR